MTKRQASKGKKPVITDIDPGKSEAMNGVEVQDFGEGIDAEVAERVCQFIETSARGLDHICSTNEGLVSSRQFHRWLEKSLALRQRYVRARDRQAEFMVYQALEIVDDTTHDTIVTEKGHEIPNGEWIQRSKVRADLRMRIAGKLSPKKWGEKIDVTSDHKPIAPPVVGMVVKRRGEDE